MSVSASAQTVNKEMILKGSQELIKSHNNRVASMICVGVSSASMVLSTQTESTHQQGLYLLSGLSAASAIALNINANMHIKRAGLYIQAGVTGVTITF